MTQTLVSTTENHTAEQAAAPYISVVIPLYNEEESIPHLYEKLTEALEAYGKPYEVIIVDDGSTDGSYPLLRQIAEKDKRFRIVRLRPARTAS